MYAPGYFGPAYGSIVPPPFNASDVLFWEFKPAAPGNQSAQLSQSSQWQKVLAAAKTADGAPLSPSEIDAMGVQIAFVQNSEPADSDWHNMRVQPKVEGGIYAPAYVRVGLGGAAGSGAAGIVNLSPGTYQRYVRVKSTPHEEYKLPPFTVEGPNP